MNPDLIFSYNEVFGPFSCEMDGCGEEAWEIVITPEEALKLPDGERFEKACFVFRNNMGKAVCSDCLRNL